MNELELMIEHNAEKKGMPMADLDKLIFKKNVAQDIRTKGYGYTLEDLKSEPESAELKLEKILSYYEESMRADKDHVPSFKFAYKALDDGINIAEKDNNYIGRKYVMLLKLGDMVDNILDIIDNHKDSSISINNDVNLVYAKKALLRLAQYDGRKDFVKAKAKHVAEEFIKEYKTLVINTYSQSYNTKGNQSPKPITPELALDRAYIMYKLANDHEGMMKTSFKMMNHNFYHGLRSLSAAIIFYIHTPIPHQEHRLE